MSEKGKCDRCQQEGLEVQPIVPGSTIRYCETCMENFCDQIRSKTPNEGIKNQENS